MPEENSEALDIRFPEGCTESAFLWSMRFQAGSARKCAETAKFGRRNINGENRKQKSKKSARVKVQERQLHLNRIRKFSRTARLARFPSLTGKRFLSACASRHILQKG